MQFIIDRDQGLEALAKMIGIIHRETEIYVPSNIRIDVSALAVLVSVMDTDLH
jgi:hypothetical protein